MGSPLGDASKGNMVFRGHAVHLLPCIKERGLFGQDHRILKGGGFGNDTGFGVGLQVEIGVFEFETIGEREEIPALVKEGPEIGAVAPPKVVQDGLIHFKGYVLFL